MNLVERLNKLGSVVERPLWWVCVILVVGITALTITAVVLRYCFNLGYQVIDEINRYSFIAMVYLWGGTLVPIGAHLRLELTPLEFKGRKRNIQQLVINTIYCATCTMFFIWGISATQTSKMLAEKSDSFVFMVWWIHFIITCGMFLQVFYSLLEIIKYIMLLFSKEETTA